MQNGTFVIYGIEETLPNTGFQTKSWPLSRASPWSGTVFTSIDLGAPSPAAGYDCAVIIHRKAVTAEGKSNTRWEWRNNNVKSLVEVTSFPAYYKEAEKLFFCRCGRNTACEALSKLCKVSGGGLSLTKKELDLTLVKNHLLSSKSEHSMINGAWISRKNAETIKSQAAFGKKITNNSNLLNACEEGKISNLAVQWPRKPKPIKASISCCGSVHFLAEHDLGECLAFVEYLAVRFGV